jgi:hypothetical protein
MSLLHAPLPHHRNGKLGIACFNLLLGDVLKH